MKIDLFLISPFEEYAEKHMCRRHWNYEWRGRRGWFLRTDRNILLRKETFGGLLKASDGKIYKLDDRGYEFVKKILNGLLINEICDDLNISIREAKCFAGKLTNLGVVLNG